MRTLCIAGPTASGKSALALALAQELDAEIISMDSALVYRRMDVGTAKPSAAERAALPHHLIDIREPYEPYNAADFARDARRLIGAIHARGKVALIVGGTMLYFKALTEGLAELPQANEAIRAEIAEEAAAKSWPAMHAELALHDALTAARLAPNDSQRVGRALEVWRATGKALSQWIAEQPAADALDVPLVSLEPQNRTWLHARIKSRFEVMLAAGFEAEMQALRLDPQLSAQTPAMRAVGYRQAWEAMDRGLSGAALQAELMQTGVAATRQLAKRQLTWLRSMPNRAVFSADTQTPHDAAKGILKRFFAGI